MTRVLGLAMHEELLPDRGAAGQRRDLTLGTRRAEQRAELAAYDDAKSPRR